MVNKMDNKPKFQVGEIVYTLGKFKSRIINKRKAHGGGWEYQLWDMKVNKLVGKWCEELYLWSYPKENPKQPETTDKAVQPDHYKADDTKDLIAMWATIYEPNEFRSVMFSHITKYLYRYANKNGKQDFEKAKEYIRRLKKFEDEHGGYK